MISTIQIRHQIKEALDRFRENKETYEEIIVKLIRLAEEYKRRNEELLIEGCKEMAEDSLRITKEWDAVNSELDWEWNEN